MKVILLALIISVFVSRVAEAQCTPATEDLIASHLYSDARNQLQTELSRRPTSDSAMHCFALVLLEQDKPGEAIEWLEKAVRVNTKSAEHHLALGNAIGAQAEKVSAFRRPFLAKRFKTEMEIAVSIDPNIVDARRSLVMYHTMAPGVMGGSLAKAKEQQIAIAKLNPMRGHTSAGTIAEKENDLARAEKEFQAAIATHPDSVAGYYALGAFYSRHQRWTESIPALEKAIRFGTYRTPSAVVSSAHLLLGIGYRKTGNQDRARSEFMSAIQASPLNKDARKELESLK